AQNWPIRRCASPIASAHSCMMRGLRSWRTYSANWSDANGTYTLYLASAFCQPGQLRGWVRMLRTHKAKILSQHSLSRSTPLGAASTFELHEGDRRLRLGP